jgi:tRNA U34 5-carboxymethylaminomethyl modifying GTPase MnmE/TrmE
VAKTIQDSFNVVSTASADEDMKRLLGELHHAVVAMLEQAKAQGVVTEEEEETVARDLEALAREAVAANPRRKWYQLNAESLRDAATKLGEIGTPVLDVTARVLALLA